MNLKQILENVDKEILTEETLDRIETAFNEAVVQKVNERVDLEVESALIELDEDHSKKLDRVIRAIDEDHTTKLKYVVRSIENDHVKKLKCLVRKYDRELTESAGSHIDVLAEEISNYLDGFVEELVPSNVIREAAKNTHASNLLREAKNVLSVDETLANSQVREAIRDGATQIKTLKRENARLKKIKSFKQGESLLERATANMSNSKTNFIKRRLSGKPVEFIKENFRFVEKMYEEKEARASHLSSPSLPHVDRQSAYLASEGDLITESSMTSTENEGGSPMDVYLNGLTHQR